MNAWIRNWMAKGWVNSQGKPVANRKLWEQLHALASEFDDIRFHKVKGHAGLEGNERADELANHGMDEVQDLAS